jgi:hypothetical protein
MGDAVEVMIEFDVVVDVYSDIDLPLGELEPRAGQWLQSRTVELGPPRAPGAVEAREGPIVEPVEPLADRPVQLGAAEEAW